MNRKVYNKEEVSGIIQAYSNGESMKKIAKDFNCSTTFIYNVLRRHKVERTRNFKSEFDLVTTHVIKPPRSRKSILHAKKLVIPYYKKHKCSAHVHKELRRYSLKKSSIDRILMWYFYLNGERIPALQLESTSKQFFPKSVDHPHENLYGTPQYNYHEVKSELLTKF